MDEGYLAQDYYRKLKAKITIKDKAGKTPSTTKPTVGRSTSAANGAKTFSRRIYWNSLRNAGSILVSGMGIFPQRNDAKIVMTCHSRASGNPPVSRQMKKQHDTPQT